MAKRRLTQGEIRKCVFTQRYRKVGPDQFVREKPYIDIDLEGDELPEKYKDPVIETADGNPPKELPDKSQVLVRVYDKEAISADRDDLLGDAQDAGARCDAALEATEVHILDDLSRY